jgi:hypothetical protein
MCKGEGCPLKKECHRHTVEPSKYNQSYFENSPNFSGLRCEYFIYNGR